MRCSTCNIDNPPDMKFCGNCGAPLRIRCPKCGGNNPPQFKFCGDCGAALQSGTVTSPQRSAASTMHHPVGPASVEENDIPAGERKTVTALFADIKSSTELMEHLDPEQARGIIDPTLKLMIDTVRRYDGYVVQSTGDGIFALFGAPVANEDHPRRALYAALSMQDELRHHNDRRSKGAVPLEVRVGVSTGEVVMRSILTGEATAEYTAIGHTANLASRLQALARSGSIVVSEQTRKLVTGYFHLESLGFTQIRGVSTPAQIYEVTGLGPLRTRLQAAARQGLTKFVGRQSELVEMRRALELAKRGHGRIVAVVGEPGVGKSRLFHEFKSAVHSGDLVLEAYSLSHAKPSAYLPLIELLKEYFGILPEDDERKRREKVAGKIVTLDRALEDTLPYLFALLGIQEHYDPLAQMDAQIKQRRTLQVLKRILLRQSLNQPVIFIFEDLHWVDSETQTLLNLLADSIANTRLLLLVNYRPEYRHDWISKSYYTQLRLDPLATERAEEMLSVLLAEGDQLIALKRLIIEKTEGNPFFIEELVQTLLDQGVLTRNGVVKLVKPLTEIRVPPTVQGILASRIDRLPPEEKDLLQTVAVAGRKFSLSVVKQLVRRSDDELNRMLAALQRGEFIYEQPGFHSTEYSFRHALTQEVAYTSILAQRRSVLHERVAQAIEVLFADRLDDHLADLANHYSRSGNIREAVRYLIRAGQQAAQRSAYSAAVQHISGGLELVKSLPDKAERVGQELLLQVALGRCVTALKGSASPEVEQAYLRARELCCQVRQTPLLFPVLLGLRLSYHNQGRIEAARALSEQALELAVRSGEPTTLVSAHIALGQSLLWLGAFADALHHLSQALALHHSAQKRPFLRVEARVSCLGSSSLALWFLGSFSQAARRAEETLTEAHTSARPGSLTEALVFAGQVAQYRRDGHEALNRAEAAIELSVKEGFSLWHAQATFQRGWALANLGQVEEGITDMRRGIAALEAIGTMVGTWQFVEVAEGYAAHSAPNEGLRAIDEGFDMMARTGERTYEAELYRVQGELLLTSHASDPGQAERCFRAALEVARRQGAMSLELRATTSLARLLGRQGRRDEGHPMLAEAYGRFTEGFDTADLTEAKALLDELGA